MSRVNLLGGSYDTPGLIASAQRCINLFPEVNPDEVEAGTKVTHYDRPCLTYLSPCPGPGRGRGLFTSSAGINPKGDLFAVVDTGVYYISPDWTWTLLGNLLTPGTTPTSYADNGTTGVFVDGSPNGYSVALTTGHAFGQIGDPNFMGADRADFMDTFLIFNQPGTPNWYASLSNSVSFNALDFGTKSAWSDNLYTLIAAHRQVWLLGVQKGEVWYNAGATPFAFQQIQGNIIEHGIAAKYSVAKQDVSCYWLSQSPEGDRMVMKGDQDLIAKRISNHALEAELKTYATIADAVGATYQERGHAFYKLHFPSADATWVYDEATKLWHQRAYCDGNGILHRERDGFNAFAYGINVGLDWSNGTLYALDPAQYIDQISPGSLATGNTFITAPLVRVRGTPHIVRDKFQRISYTHLIADIEVGSSPSAMIPDIVGPWSNGFSAGFGPNLVIEPPLMTLRMSKDRGNSFRTCGMRGIGGSADQSGQYTTTPSWWNLGLARDAVFELTWSVPQQTALQGIFVEVLELEE